MSFIRPGGIDRPALAVFLFFFVLVTVLGFVAARWRRPRTLAHLDEWGLGGRQFGTWITWFLIGGDLYTAYTVIAVPALIYGVGAYGFFALPYAILIYPLMLALIPKLWQEAATNGHVTAADVVYGRWTSRPLEAAIALTGIIATMPYIALQLVGMQVVIHALGLAGDFPLIAAFLILALYTYSAGLRAPALIAFVKDGMIYLVVLVAIVVVPLRLGGYGAVFHAADAAFRSLHKPGAGILLSPAQILPYATVTLGSGLAVFLYPHTLTGLLAARSQETIRRNAVLLPAYSMLLGLIGILGLAAYAAGIRPTTPTAEIPTLFAALFPSWFAGFALAAIAIGALVPAAVMSIGAANLFTRNIYKASINRAATPAQETRVAKLASLVVKLGALCAIIFLPTEYAIDLQLLGGIWILQTFPALLGGLLTRSLTAPALLAGWAAGMAVGTMLVALDGLKPVHSFAFGTHHVGVYSGLFALAVNLAIVAILSPLSRSASPRQTLPL